MLEKSENRVGLLLNLPAEINIYIQEQMQDYTCDYFDFVQQYNSF